MLSYPTTKDAGTLLAVLPDWGEGITGKFIYRTDIQTSRSGLEQRGQRRRRPLLSMEYTTRDLYSEEARRRLEEIVSTSRGKLIVPWWVSGLQLSQDMTVVTSAQVASNPISADWEKASHVFFWHPQITPEFREMVSITERLIVMTGTGTLYPAGTYVFPCVPAVRDKDASLLSQKAPRTNTERMIFRTL